MEYRGQYNSPLGTLVMVSDGQALTELRFSALPVEPSAAHSPVLELTCCWLDAYFRGEEPRHLPPMAPYGTPFQQRVWTELLRIPYGKTTSYGKIACSIGCRSAQAVGGAVHRNPIAILIPCHRVIGSNGSLTGYAYGLDIKQQLLQIETHRQ